MLPIDEEETRLWGSHPPHTFKNTVLYTRYTRIENKLMSVTFVEKKKNIEKKFLNTITCNVIYFFTTNVWHALKMLWRKFIENQTNTQL